MRDLSSEIDYLQDLIAGEHRFFYGSAAFALVLTVVSIITAWIFFKYGFMESTFTNFKDYGAALNSLPGFAGPAFGLFSVKDSPLKWNRIKCLKYLRREYEKCQSSATCDEKKLEELDRKFNKVWDGDSSR
jgi:hypothetical protein